MHLKIIQFVKIIYFISLPYFLTPILLFSIFFHQKLFNLQYKVNTAKYE